MSPSAVGCTSPLLKEETNFEPKGRIKCVLVGDGAVGKTSLVVSYSTNGFPHEYVPTAFDNYSVSVRVDGQPLTVQLCDTAGQDDFDPLRPLCYPDTDVFLVCFSVVCPASFRSVGDRWAPEVRRHCPGAALLLVGTQSDCRRDARLLRRLAHYGEQPVPEARARDMARRLGADGYVETSALTQRQLKEAFDQAIVTALAARRSGEGRGSPAAGGCAGGSSAKRKRNNRAGKEATSSSFWRRLCCLS